MAATLKTPARPPHLLRYSPTRYVPNPPALISLSALPPIKAAAAAAAGAKPQLILTSHSSNPNLSLRKPLSSLSQTLPSLQEKPQESIGGRRPMTCYAVKSGMETEEKSASDERMLVIVPPHPLIKHWISVLRNEQTPCVVFKNAMAELGRLLIYEASRDWLPTITGEIQTPMGVASVEFIDPREPIMIVPILRAGLALMELAPSVLPATKTYHLGMRRDETTLQPSIYLDKLPDTFPEGSRVLVVDPMLATGGTIVAAIDLLKKRGVDNKKIKVISAVAAPPALQKLSKKFPGLHVYTGIIDPVVNEKGFIVPGLGDAGDRSFDT